MKDREWIDFFYEWYFQASSSDFPEDKKRDMMASLHSCSRRYMILKLVWQRLKDDISELRKLFDEAFPFPISGSVGEEDKERIIKIAREKFSDPEHKYARDQATLKVIFDLEDLWIHGRILMDRIAFLTKFFLKDVKHHSFNAHRKYFLKNTFPEDEEYATYIREETNWFENHLRTPRDDWIVHALPTVTGGLSLSGDSARLSWIEAKKQDSYKVTLDPDSLLDCLDDFVHFFTRHFRARKPIN